MVDMDSMVIQKSFPGEAANWATPPIKRQKSPRNLPIAELDPSVPRSVLFEQPPIHQLYKPPCIMKISLIISLSVLAVTSCLADQQADLMAQLKASPVEDFSGKNANQLTALAQADAMVYFQANKDVTNDIWAESKIGLVHAFKHRLVGDSADTYKVQFSLALNALVKGRQ
jgi:hypothetical protein